jgi:predicted homoserine dehydrogenase-like protein
MVIVDTALQRRHQEGNPIRVAMVGAGFMGSAIALEIVRSIVGMKLVAISNRTLSKAEEAYRNAGVDSVEVVGSVHELEDAVSRGRYAITDDPMLLGQAGNIDAVIDATAEIEFGAHVAMNAIAHGKHVILMNAELDATLGPILKVYADRAGVVITYTDGDEPGVAMNLYRFLKTVGYEPLLMGQIKGLLDRYRNPHTQREFAEKYKQKPAMVASFADGSKLSLESTIMANATGFKVGRRGMYGPHCAHVKDVINHFSSDQLRSDGGWVDFVLGAEPGTGAFVVAYNDQPVKREYMQYFKMGSGPMHVFYQPFHLAHLQVPLSVARAVLFNDATIAPLAGPVCDTLTFAKRNLTAGTTLDGMGGFTCYGAIDTYEISQAERLLPMTLSQGCRLKRDVLQDQPIGYADVELPVGRLCDRLRDEQAAFFAPHKTVLAMS